MLSTFLLVFYLLEFAATNRGGGGRAGDPGRAPRDAACLSLCAHASPVSRVKFRMCVSEGASDGSDGRVGTVCCVRDVGLL